MHRLVRRMAGTLLQRGPDGSGDWCDPAAGIVLGHRRLSVVDLSSSGHQPMTSHCGRFVIAYNGEVYSHDELRKELVAKGHSFRGHSDTEVLLEGFAEWGIVATIQRCLGMFAIAVWDRKQRELTLIRDRLGKKPLYYGRFGSTLLFGSELKALRAHPAFVGEIDRDTLAQFLRWCYVPHPHSIYRGVRSLLPGTILTIRADETSLPEPIPFWSFDSVCQNGIEKPFRGSFEDATGSLDELLTDAVGRRMIADVPLGAFLSGGIDSSLVVSLMQKQSSRPVKTFTIGFDEETYNEAPFAARVASHLKTDHTELYVTPQQARDVIPRLPTMFDEPFADSSQIPTFLVSQLARRDVTVALSGDGGDELFCGYRRYFEASETAIPQDLLRRLARRIQRLPAFLRTPMQAACRAAGQLPLGQLSTFLERAAVALGDDGPHARYLRNLSHWGEDSDVVLGTQPHRGASLLRTAWPTTFDNIQQVWQWFDTQTYLPDDILTKVDRASMAVSLEARTPLLDHRVVEFSWTLPHEFKVQDGRGKRILREVLSKYIPRELFERPKVGFGVPIDEWLRGPLRDWAEDLLDETRLRREGYLNPMLIRRKWSEHQSGRADWHYLLWDVLMFQAWLVPRQHLEMELEFGL